jgi:Mrp family chromosome partitioning ATPase
MIRLIKNIKFLIVTTPSQLAFETVKKLTSLLASIKIPVIGLVENMKMDNSQAIQQQAQITGLKYLGKVPYDTRIEETLGNTNQLQETTFAKGVGQIATKI